MPRNIEVSDALEIAGLAVFIVGILELVEFAPLVMIACGLLMAFAAYLVRRHKFSRGVQSMLESFDRKRPAA